MFYTALSHAKKGNFGGNFQTAFDAYLSGQPLEDYNREVDIPPFRFTKQTEIVATRSRDQLNYRLTTAAIKAWRYFPKSCPVDDAYHTFQIPKSSGGMRTITAPNPNLKIAQRCIYEAFINPITQQPTALEHDAAFAYVKGRSIKDALARHRDNESKWFLKLDIKDFFPSCSKELLQNVFNNIFPMNMVNQDIVEYILHIAMKDGGLPQGGVLSPYLSNMIMLPFDYYVTHKTWVYHGNHYVYTRYADDILISSKGHFDKSEFIELIGSLLPEGMRVNTDKTRYGSSAGRNWNLGLMLNKDNNITIGYRNKTTLKGEIHAFLTQTKAGNFCSLDYVRSLAGNVAYFQQIEPEYAQYVIRRLEAKTGVYYKDMLKKTFRHYA